MVSLARAVGLCCISLPLASSVALTTQQLQGAREPLPAPVEVVVAQYTEDVSWISQYQQRGVQFLVYCKGDVCDGAFETLPNVGREGHTFLYHIVKNYDRLADWTVFTQGAAPTWGFRAGDPDSGHLSDDVTFQDYLQKPDGKDSFFVFSAACNLPRGSQLTRLGLMTTQLSHLGGSCPSDAAGDGAAGWSDWWWEDVHPHTIHGEEMLRFYSEQFLQRTDVPDSLTLTFAQGARFAVSRERILVRPLEFYKRLLALLESSVNPPEGFYLEAMWYDVFYPEALQADAPICPLPEMPEGNGMSVWEMCEATQRRLSSVEPIDYYLCGSHDDAPHDDASHDDASRDEVSMIAKASVQGAYMVGGNGAQRRSAVSSRAFMSPPGAYTFGQARAVGGGKGEQKQKRGHGWATWLSVVLGASAWGLVLYYTNPPAN